MNWNLLVFVVFPYVAITLAIVGTVYRMIRRPFTVSSLSSQLLESRKLFWGSVPFHWGILVILGAHFVALVLPAGLDLWNRAPIRLYLLEITGLALALWALFGLGMLIYRRVGIAKIRAVTTRMDLVVLGLLLLQVITGTCKCCNVLRPYLQDKLCILLFFLRFMKNVLKVQQVVKYTNKHPHPAYKLRFSSLCKLYQ